MITLNKQEILQTTESVNSRISILYVNYFYYELNVLFEGNSVKQATIVVC